MDEIITTKISQIRSKLSQVSDESREVLSEVVNLIEYLAGAEKIVPAVEVPTIDEFIRKAKLKKHSDKVLCIAYFLEEREELESFTVKDIDEAYKKARFVPPKNLNDTIQKLKGRGLLIEIGKKEKLKSWRLSSDGIDYVKSLFGDKDVF
jgi:hypothetical protein